jgi:hypothetical protein
MRYKAEIWFTYIGTIKAKDKNPKHFVPGVQNGFHVCPKKLTQFLTKQKAEIWQTHRRTTKIKAKKPETQKMLL